MTDIVVGFDGSGSAVLALEWGFTAAAARGLPLKVVAVVQERLIPGSGVAMPAAPEDLDVARRAAQEAVRAVQKGSGERVEATVVAVGGQPAAVLLAAAEGADQVVVGSRGLGGFARLLLGSVSSQVVHHARCPVTVVPAPAGKS